MKKILAFLCLALGFSTWVDARSLVLVLKDGSEVYYLIDSQSTPVMKFVNNEITVHDDQYTFTGIQKFFISDTDDPNAIGSVTESTDKPVLKNGILYLTQNAKTQVYTADGKLVKTAVSTQGGQVTIRTTDLPTGTYIVKTGKNNFKFTKR